MFGRSGRPTRRAAARGRAPCACAPARARTAATTAVENMRAISPMVRRRAIWPAVTGSTGRGDFSTRAQFLGRTLGAGALLALGDATGLITSAPKLRGRASRTRVGAPLLLAPRPAPAPARRRAPVERDDPGLLFLAPVSGPGQSGPLILDDAGQVDLVQADDAADCDRLPHRAVPREHRAHVVGGLAARRPRRGRVRHRGRDLQGDRALRRRQPPRRGRARVPDHPAGHGADHELGEADDEPPADRRPLERDRDRRRGAGARDPELARAVRVAQPRPRRRRRVAPPGAGPLRLLPHQLDRPRARRRPARLGAQHVGRLQDQPQGRPRRLAARREAQRLPAGPRRGVRLAARRPLPRATAGSSASSTTRSGPVARSSRARSCSSWTSSAGARRSSASSRTARRSTRGRTAARSCSPTAATSSAGAPSRTSRSTPPTARCATTRGCRTPGESYRAFRLPWIGLPAEPPTLYQRILDRTRVYASWNGATKVHTWQLRVGPSADAAPAGLVRPEDRLRGRVRRCRAGRATPP